MTPLTCLHPSSSAALACRWHALGSAQTDCSGSGIPLRGLTGDTAESLRTLELHAHKARKRNAHRQLVVKADGPNWTTHREAALQITPKPFQPEADQAMLGGAR